MVSVSIATGHKIEVAGKIIVMEVDGHVCLHILRSHQGEPHGFGAQEKTELPRPNGHGT